MSDDEVKNSEELQEVTEEQLQELLDTDDSELSEEELEAKEMLKKLTDKTKKGIFSIHTRDYESEDKVATPRVSSRILNNIIIGNAPGDPVIPTAVDLTQVIGLQKFPSDKYPNTWILATIGGYVHIQLDRDIDLVEEWLKVIND